MSQIYIVQTIEGEVGYMASLADARWIAFLGWFQASCWCRIPRIRNDAPHRCDTCAHTLVDEPCACPRCVDALRAIQCAPRTGHVVFF